MVNCKSCPGIVKDGLVFVKDRPEIVEVPTIFVKTSPQLKFRQNLLTIFVVSR